MLAQPSGDVDALTNIHAGASTINAVYSYHFILQENTTLMLRPQPCLGLLNIPDMPSTATVCISGGISRGCRPLFI